MWDLHFNRVDRLGERKGHFDMYRYVLMPFSQFVKNKVSIFNKKYNITEYLGYECMYQVHENLDN